MQLYMVPLAPNPTKVMLYLAERQERGSVPDIEQIVVNTLKGKHREPEHLARNPFGTLPVLQLEDGSFLRESLTIIDYLESKFPDGALITGSIEQQAKARELERIVDLKLAGPMGTYVHVTKSPIGIPADPQRAAQVKENMAKPLDFLNELLSDGRPYLFGEDVTIADFTLQSALQFVRFIKEDLIESRQQLLAWDTRYRERPAAIAVLKW
jgi:glutathione S-transferase